jgi:alpha-beta hydrolase superfamily lysophospholipase
MGTIFISHSSEDESVATELKHLLEMQGYRSVFLDFDPALGIPAGRDWEQELYRQLRTCQAMIVLCSEHSMSSCWCFAEITHAKSLGKHVFPVKVGPCKIDPVLMSRQIIDLTQNQEDGYQRLWLGLKVAGLDPADSFDWDGSRSPYPGMMAFQKADAAVFFGREQEIQQGLETLRRLRQFGGPRMLLVLGASGNGKSSIVRAGLLPRLRKNKEHWLVLDPFRPQDHPFRELSIVLAKAFSENGLESNWKEICYQLEQAAQKEKSHEKTTINDVALELQIAQKQRDATTLMVIDQAEELLVSLEKERTISFLSLLCSALEIPDSPIMVIFTLRSDFLLDFQRQPHLRDLSCEHLSIGPMATDQIHKVIEGPAERAGIEIEDGLTQAMVQDTKNQDALPLLAFTLRELYKRSGNDYRLTMHDYREKLRGLSGAVARAANAALAAAKLTSDQKEDLRNAFVSLARINEEGQFIRQTASWSDMPESVHDVLERFVQARLIVSRGKGKERVLEVAHEAIFHSWRRLKAWLDEDREALRIRQRLSDTSMEWAKAGQDESYLYRGARLAEAEEWMQSNAILMKLDKVEKEFLQKSIYLRDKKVSEKKARKRKERLLLVSIFSAVVIIFAALVVFPALSSRKMPALEPWHFSPHLEDNLTRASYNDFSEYLAAESQFLATIQNGVTIEETSSFNRYARNKKSSPDVSRQNLNASFEFLPDEIEIKGGVLLVHGVTDSPYHLRAIGRLFFDNGFYVIGLRLPGHGTVPGGLLNVTWEEWYSAVKFGARMVLEKIENRKDSKFYVGGFSTGGALTLRYFLETSSEKLKDSAVDNHRIPDKLLLLSPAIGLNPFAEILDWQIIISKLSYSKKFSWLNIGLEYDPFKYISFAKNAGNQIYDLTKANQKLIEEIARNESIKEKLHPIYAFQSSADATVKTDKLVDMYEKIASKESELFLFDINRLYETFINDDVEKDNLLHSEKIKNMVSKVWLISNKPKEEGDGYETSVAIKLVSKSPESDSPAEKKFGRLVGLKWPGNVFALSHGCIPISPKDKIYGCKSILGGINVKGEKDVLLIPDDLGRLRVRYNPFFQLIKERLVVSFLRSNEY